VAPAEQTPPVEQLALAEQPAPVEQLAPVEQPEPVDQSTRADQNATTEQTAPAAPAVSPDKVARLNLEDDAADATKRAPAPGKKIARKKRTKTRVAAKSHHKHRTRVAARFNTADSMFGQPRFMSAPQTFQPRRVRKRRREKSAACKLGGRRPLRHHTGPLASSRIDAERPRRHVRPDIRHWLLSTRDAAFRTRPVARHYGNAGIGGVAQLA
jgi:hypothetical protein